MAPISSTNLAAQDRELLLKVAEASIRHGLEDGLPLRVEAESYAMPLRAPRATFVTLYREGELRGCIGTLTVEKPLVEDVAARAFAAAFQDPRFPPVNTKEMEGLAISISVLSLPSPLEVTSEADLLSRLRVGVDGLILREGSWRRSTFLPAVWETLPDPRAFLAHLKLKAGLPADYWSDTLRFERYTTESFGNDAAKTGKCA
jgi:AmmeMemoRadiSam system protein A